jgi:hypothetical protein
MWAVFRSAALTNSIRPAACPGRPISPEIPEKFGVKNVYADVGATFAWTCVGQPRLAAAIQTQTPGGTGIIVVPYANHPSQRCGIDARIDDDPRHAKADPYPPP